MGMIEAAAKGIKIEMNQAEMESMRCAFVTEFMGKVCARSIRTEKPVEESMWEIASEMGIDL